MSDRVAGVRLIWYTYACLPLLAIFFVTADKWIYGFGGFLVVFAYGASYLICGSTLLVGSVLGTRDLLRDPASRRGGSIVTVFLGWLGTSALLPFGVGFFWS